MRYINIGFFIAFHSFLLISCAHTTSQPILKGIISAELQHAVQNYDQTLSKKRNPLSFETGQTVDTCEGFLDIIRSARIDETLKNQLIAKEYIICTSVQAVKSANLKASVDYYIPSSYGDELRQRLDLRTFSSSLGQLTDDSNFVLSALKLRPSESDTYACFINAKDWFFKIEVVAVMDFDNDGKQDWLLWLTDEAKDGNYRGYSVLLVSNVIPGTGFLKAKALP